MKGGLSNLVTVTFLFSKESSSHILTIFFHLLATIMPMLISPCIKVLSRPFLRDCFRPRISDSIYCTENNSLENSQAAGYIDYPCIFFRNPKVLPVDWLWINIFLGRYLYLLCHFYSSIRLTSSMAIILT